MRKICLLFTVYCLLFTVSYADTIYLKNATIQKGLVVEEYYDRFVFNKEGKEKEVLKSDIDEIFFDEPYQNDLYLGRKFEKEGNFDKALHFYRTAFQSNPDFKETEDAIKGLEDVKWRFNKSWRYKELKDILYAQLGVVLKKVKRYIVIKNVNEAEEKELLADDRIIRCWAQPLTYAGLKNASRVLIGRSNTILRLVIERDVKVDKASGFRLFSPLKIGMEFEGPTIKFVKEQSPFHTAGLMKGDLIVAIDQESMRYMKLAEVIKKVFKRPAKTITIRREVMLMRKKG